MAGENSAKIGGGSVSSNAKDSAGGGSLKAFFIPHAGNNYKPKSLHPKRLLLYAGVALVIKLMMVLVVFFYPMVAWMTPDVSAEEGKKIIVLTNNLRKDLSLNVLTENQKLDQAAVDKVEDMFINQYFAHLSPQNRDLEYFLKLASYKNYTMAGENLAMGFNNAIEVMTAWENSPTHYNNLVDPNFKEIGVALAGNTYLDQNTVLIAQYFGLPQVSENPISQITKKTVGKAVKSEERDILAEKTATATTTNKSTSTAPAIFEAKIIIDEPAGSKDDKVVKVEANLPVGTKNANLQVLSSNIEMTPTVEVQGNGENKWSGQAVVQNDNQSVTPPVITIGTATGEIQKVEVSGNSINPRKTSIASQYWLFKNHPNQGLSQIFNISSVYLKTILGFAVLAMLLNIFVKVRKQHPKRIISGLGLILLLIIMIVF